MFEQSAVTQVLPSVVGLVAALVAGLSVYFTYRGRHNQFRQVVYGKQMDAYFDITESMSNLYAAAQNVLTIRHAWAKGEDAGVRLRTALRDEHERFTATVNRALIVLPSKVKGAVDHFNETLLAMSAPAEEQPADSDRAVSDQPADLELALAKAYARAINCIRHHLAIDRLTTGMLKEMGIGSESVTLRSVRSGVHPLVAVGRSTP